VGRWLYVGSAIFVILVHLAGFGPSVFDESKRNGSPTLLVTAHAAAACAWLAFFFVQAMLVVLRRTAVHRRLGSAGAVLTIVTVGLVFPTVIEMSRRGYDLSGDLGRAGTAPGTPPPAAEDLAVGILAPFLGAVNFGALVAAGLWFRHRAEIHKRLMLLALLSLTLVPLIHLSGYLAGQWPGLYSPLTIAVPVVANLLLFTVAVHDKMTRGRIHPVSLWAPVLWIAVVAVVVVTIQPSATWRQLALWLVRRT
jgi:hypothetical protein